MLWLIRELWWFSIKVRSLEFISFPIFSASFLLAAWQMTNVFGIFPNRVNCQAFLPLLMPPPPFSRHFDRVIVTFLTNVKVLNGLCDVKASIEWFLMFIWTMAIYSYKMYSEHVQKRIFWRKIAAFSQLSKFDHYLS